LTSCAKCGMDLDGHGWISVGSSDKIYGVVHPCLCVVCHIKWRRVWERYRRIVNFSWKERFEAWIGYVWNGKSRMAKELVVFT